MNGQFLWRMTGIIALLSCLILGAGFVFALDPQMAVPQTAPGGIGPGSAKPPATPPILEKGKLSIVTLGDSLTRGVGDANGQGYVGLVREGLAKKTGTPPLLTNLAVSGATSPGLLDQLEQPQVKKLIAESNLILFTIGGNDLFRQNGNLDEPDEKKIAQARETLAANYAKILSTIRSLNAEATVIYLSLYNPFGNTDAATITIPPVLAWNSQAEQIASMYKNVFVVPTYDLFVKKEAAYLYTDHFHPNAQGYARMSERVLQALN
ncbi:MAG: SGNH/GDSL hydrolase family protein [Clostridia bacterium]